MKATMTWAMVIAGLIVAILVGRLEDVLPTDDSGLAWGRSHVPQKIMIPAGTVLSNGTIVSEAQASPGTIYGTVFIDGTLTVDARLTVDGQVLVGDQLGSPLGATILRSSGNQNAEPPGKPVVIWTDTKVHGPLTIHGSLVVRRSLFTLGDISFGGTMGASCGKGLIFFPAGAYPVSQKIEFGCPPS